MKMDFEKLIKKYTYSVKERENKRRTIEEIISKISTQLEEKEVDASAILVGSTARGTDLKNSDIDIFIQFDKKYEKQEMEDIGLKIGFSTLSNGIAKYAEHPYVRGQFDGITVDIVPCFKMNMNTKIISSVDRTPLHTKFLNSVMNEELKTQSILLKLFMKRLGIYGSELKTEGFSGYVIELGIFYTGSFEKFLSMISESKGQIVIGPENSKFNSPVVLVDPVDQSRNAAAAVSERAMSILRIASREYLSNPSIGLVDPEIRETANLKLEERGTYIIVALMPKPDIIDDILFPQLELMKKSLKKFIEINDFHEMNLFYTVEKEEIQFLIELESGLRPGVKIREGPPTDLINSNSFYRKYVKEENTARGPYIKKDRIYAETFRPERSFRELLLKNLKSLNIGHHLNKIRDSVILSEDVNEIKHMAVYSIFLGVCEPPYPPENISKNKRS